MPSEETVFNAALQLGSSAERAAYLDAACGGDDAFRRHIEGLLAAHEASEGLLDRPPVAAVTTVDVEPLSEGPGTVIGRFKLLQQIGEGGFGVVYMAEQKKPVRRKVALKIIKLGMDTREVIARFEAERQALAMMDHPNIARVFDAGATDTGRPYFVMELVKGVPITQYCDENSLTAAERLELFVAVCNAIQHAHQKGIIHRDIKPSNIMVTLHDGKPVPKVIDFGVAKAVNQDLTQKTLFTAYGHLIGTPQYMSPEQAEMSGLDIDTRSDVYSLGVVLYELLTGSTPLERGRLRAAGYAEMQRIIREEEPPSPSMRLSTLGEQLTIIARHRSIEPKRLQQLVRGELDWMVMKALEKERGRRYDSASALAADAVRYLTDEPVEACPPSTTYRLRKFARRHKGPFAAAAVLTATLVLGILGTSMGLIRANRAEADARQDADLAAQERDNARQAADREREARLRAEAAEDQLRKQAYVADMTLASRLLQDGEVESIPNLLERHFPAENSDLRGFEWFYLWDQCQADVVELPHWGRVWTFAFSPDGTKLASGFGDSFTIGEIKIWNTKTGRLLQTIKGMGDIPGHLRFSPDGSALAFNVEIGIQIWDVTTGRRMVSVSNSSMSPTSLAFSPDGTTVAVAGVMDPIRGGKLRLVDLASGKELGSFNSEKVLRRVAYSRDGKRIVAIAEDQLLILDAVDTSQTVQLTDSEVGHVTCFALAPDNKSFAVGTQAGIIRILDAGTLSVQHSFSGHEEAVVELAFTPQGHVVSAGRDGKVALWDQDRDEPLSTSISPGKGRMGIAFADDGSLIASGVGDNTIRLKSLDFNATRDEVPLHDDLRGLTQDMLISVSPDEKTLASVVTGEIVLYNVDLREKIASRRVGGLRRALGVEFSADGRAVAASVDGSRVKLWNAETGEQIKMLPEDVPQASCIAVSAGATTVVLGGFDGTLMMWDVASGECLGTTTEHRSAIFCLAFSPDGKMVASGGVDDVVRLWNRDTCTLRRTLTGHMDSVTALAFSPTDRTELASNSFDSTINLWNLDTGHVRATIDRAGGWALAFSPDGSRLATRDVGSIKLWDADSGAALGSIVSDGGLALAFTRKGNSIAMQTVSGGLQVFEIPEADGVQEELQQRLRREEQRESDRETIQTVKNAISLWQTAFREDSGRLPKEQVHEALNEALMLLRSKPDYYRAYAPQILATRAVLLATGTDEEQRGDDRIREVVAQVDRLAPQDAHPWNHVGGLFHFQARNWPAAKVAFENALSRSSRPTSEVLHSLAWIMSRSPQLHLRDADRAVDYARQAVELQPSERDHWNTLGVALYRQGNWQEAIEALTTSHDSADAAESLYRAIDRLFIGMSYWQLGNPEEARKWYDNAVELMDGEQLSDDEELARFFAEAEALID